MSAQWRHFCGSCLVVLVNSHQWVFGQMFPVVGLDTNFQRWLLETVSTGLDAEPWVLVTFTRFWMVPFLSLRLFWCQLMFTQLLLKVWLGIVGLFQASGAGVLGSKSDVTSSLLWLKCLSIACCRSSLRVVFSHRRVRCHCLISISNSCHPRLTRKATKEPTRFCFAFNLLSVAAQHGVALALARGLVTCFPSSQSPHPTHLHLHF